MKTQAVKKQRGRWKPGQSGNPAGRPPTAYLRIPVALIAVMQNKQLLVFNPDTLGKLESWEGARLGHVIRKLCTLNMEDGQT